MQFRKSQLNSSHVEDSWSYAGAPATAQFPFFSNRRPVVARTDVEDILQTLQLLDDSTGRSEAPVPSVIIFCQDMEEIFMSEVSEKEQLKIWQKSAPVRIGFVAAYRECVSVAGKWVKNYQVGTVRRDAKQLARALKGFRAAINKLGEQIASWPDAPRTRASGKMQLLMIEQKLASIQTKLTLQ